MYITPEVEKWLKNAGYKYYCFISWPHTDSYEMTECAKQLEKDIKSGLSLNVPRAEVFLDDEIKGGDNWLKKITETLCQSVVMVAVCAPVYFHPEHRYCHLEWTAMSKLSKKRFPDKKIHTIIPILLKEMRPWPEPILKMKIQCYDFSRVMTLGRAYYEQPEYREKKNEIVERIVSICNKLSENEREANCQDFSLPKKPLSSFNYKKEQPKQQAPFRKNNPSLLET